MKDWQTKKLGEIIKLEYGSLCLNRKGKATVYILFMAQMGKR